MQTFMIDNHKMAYMDQGIGPVLVFGHSYLWDHAMWAPQVEILSQHYRCIVPDFWAHGGSDPAPMTTRTLRDYADNILALLDHLNVDKFSMIGLGVGGMWGAELALKASTRVTALVLMDTFLGYEPEVMVAKYLAMLDIIRDQQQIPKTIINDITPLFFGRDTQQHESALVAGFQDTLLSLQSERAIAISDMGRMIFGRRDTFDDIEFLTMPTLIMSGIEDRVHSPLEAQLMHDEIAGSQYVLIPDAGHISNLEQPQFVTEQLQRFLVNSLSN